MTSSTFAQDAQAQGAAIPFASSPLDDPYHLYSHTLHHGFHTFSFSRLSHHPNSNDGLSVIHGLRPNQKLKAILEGCANLNHLWGSSLTAHNLFAEAFFLPQCVYIRFTHIMNMQPKFYIGSAMHHTLDREYSRSRKFLQLTNDKLVQAELALRFWKEHNNLYAWAPIRLFVERADYRCLELALIQEWQPRLNYPFICQLFHPRKGILKKPAMNTNAQFGLATLKDILTSDRCQNRLELWTIIHSLGTNTKARFEQTKFLRSNEGGLTQCYTLRRLANNIQEPYRTLSLQAIDASIRWWQGKPAPRASALRAPWSLSPNLQKSPNNSSATGISKFCPTKSHAIHRLSRQCSLSMLRCLTNCATTNKRSPNGPPIPMLNAAAQRPSTLLMPTGSWQVPYSQACSRTIYR